MVSLLPPNISIDFNIYLLKYLNYDENSTYGLLKNPDEEIHFEASR